MLLALLSKETACLQSLTDVIASRPALAHVWPLVVRALNGGLVGAEMGRAVVGLSVGLTVGASDENAFLIVGRNVGKSVGSCVGVGVGTAARYI